MVILLKIYTFFYGLGKARCKKGVVTDFTPRKSFLQTSILIKFTVFIYAEGRKERRKERRKEERQEGTEKGMEEKK